MTLRSGILIATCAAAVLVQPAETYAQRRAVRVAPPRTVFVGSYYYRPLYRPIYRPAFYRPLHFGAWYQYPVGYPPYYGYPRGHAVGSLRLQVSPEQAEVFVDGYYAGNVDDFDGVFQRLDVEPGEHDVELYLQGHRPVRQKVYVQPGRTFRIRHTMEPLAAGEPEAPRPAAAGPQPVAGQPTDVERAAGGATAPPVRRAPAPPQISGNARESAYGSLALRVQPGDAEVLIDGERWNSSGNDERLIVQLSAGVHNIEIRKAGYRAYSTDVTVRSGETATVNVALTRN